MPENYPFPQCWTTTQSYDIDFVGPVKQMKLGEERSCLKSCITRSLHNYPAKEILENIESVQSSKHMANAAGDVTYGYHRFGPTDKTRPVKAPVVMLAGFATLMYIWPIPVSKRRVR
jgi:hypothetical protein